MISSGPSSISSGPSSPCPAGNEQAHYRDCQIHPASAAMRMASIRVLASSLVMTRER